MLAIEAGNLRANSDKENVRKLKLILKEAEKWRKKHGTQFEPSKYVLTHFTRYELRFSMNIHPSF